MSSALRGRSCASSATTDAGSQRRGLYPGALRRAFLSCVVVLAASASLGGAAEAKVGAVAAHPQIQVGGFPTGIALNPVTNTIYVGNGTTGTLSLINGKKCNAGDAGGCGQHVTAVTAGTDPIGIAVNGTTNTVYVANASGTVAVVSGRTCDAANMSRCHVQPATVRVGANPQFLAVDQTTNTIYVANSSANTVSVIDGSTRRVRATVPVGPLPFTLTVNEATSSVYVTDLGAATISVIDARACNAANVNGCGHKPIVVNVGQTPGGIAVNTRTDTIYVTGEFSNDVSVIDGKTCNARTTSGCRQTPVHVLAGAGARGIAVNEVTNTVYVANTAANTVSVINGATCNATEHSGCGQKAAVAPVGISPRRVAVDPVTNTIYVTNAGSNSVTMLDGRTCSGVVHTGCGPAGIPSPKAPPTTTTPPSIA
jgi:YVTN family beta-propeller protein